MNFNSDVGSNYSSFQALQTYRQSSEQGAVQGQEQPLIQSTVTMRDLTNVGAGNQQQIVQLIDGQKQNDGSQFREMLNLHNQRFDELKINYSKIFGSEIFDKVNNVNKILKLKGFNLVNKNHYSVIQAKRNNQYVGTLGLRAGFAVCALGKNRKNETFLFLSHIQSIKPKDIFQLAMQELYEKNCLAESIEIYTIGGALDENNCCINYEEEFLRLSAEYPLKGVRFNLLRPIVARVHENPHAHIETLSIAFSQDKIIYATKTIFEAVKYQTSNDTPLCINALPVTIANID